MTIFALHQARQIAQTLTRLGIQADPEIIAIIADGISEAEAMARADERKRVAADILAATIPADVLQMAAETITARTF
jgi:hypothetical protein